MADQSEPPMPGDVVRSRGRMPLRALFVFTFCFVVGLTIESRNPAATRALFTYISGLGSVQALENYRWYGLLMATVAIAMAIGIVCEASALRRRLTALTAHEAPWRFALRLEIGWRLAIAALIAASLVARYLYYRFGLLRARGDAEEWQSLPTHHLLWLAMIVVLIAAVARHVPQRVRRQPIEIMLFASFLAAATVVYLTIDSTLIVSLVHRACWNIDSRLKFTGNRYGRAAPEIQEWVAIGGVLAACAWGAASLMLADALRRRTHPRIATLETALGAGLLAAGAAYCVWFARTGFPAMSPEVGTVPRASNWFLDVTAVVMAMVVITAVALRCAREDEASPMRVACPPQLYESWLCLATLAISIFFFAYDFVRLLYELFEQNTIPIPGVLVHFAKDPTTFLQLAILLLGLQLAWKRWWNREPESVLVIRRASPARFVWAWVALAGIVAVGVPTLVAFAHSRWLTP